MRSARAFSIILFVTLFVVGCSERSPVETEQTKEVTLLDRSFVKNTYFFLDRPPDAQFPNAFFRPKIDSIEVFSSVLMRVEPATFLGRAWVDSLGDGSGIGVGPNFERRFFRLLKVNEDYRFVLDAADLTTVIGLEMTRSVPQGEVLAVRYVNERGDVIGNFGVFPSTAQDTLRMELIWPPSPLREGIFGYTWEFMMRHIYNLGLSNIDPTTFELEILENAPRLDNSTPDGASIPWVRIFGLDRVDQSGLPNPDNLIDIGPSIIDLNRGLLVFPNFRPFDPDPALVAEYTDGQFAFTGEFADLLSPEIYTESNLSLLSPKFTIRARAASTTANSLSRRRP